MFTSNGGHRHHFVSASALGSNDYSTTDAYCIRMMVPDHYPTGSYGNSAYVLEESTLIKQREYVKVLENVISDLKSKMDSEGSNMNLQQKYYDEVVACLIYYEALFKI